MNKIFLIFLVGIILQFYFVKSNNDEIFILHSFNSNKNDTKTETVDESIENNESTEIIVPYKNNTGVQIIGERKESENNDNVSSLNNKSKLLNPINKTNKISNKKLKTMKSNEKKEKHRESKETKVNNNSSEKTNIKENIIEVDEIDAIDGLDEIDINNSNVIDNQNINSKETKSSYTKTLLISIGSGVIIIFGFIIGKKTFGRNNNSALNNKSEENVVTPPDSSIKRGYTVELLEERRKQSELYRKQLEEDETKIMRLKEEVKQKQFEKVEAGQRQLEKEVNQNQFEIEEAKQKEMKAELYSTYGASFTRNSHSVIGNPTYEAFLTRNSNGSTTGNPTYGLSLGRNSNCSTISKLTFIASLSRNSNGSTISSLIGRYGLPINSEALYTAEGKYPAIFVTFPSMERPFKPVLPVEYDERDPNHLYPCVYKASNCQKSSSNSSQDSDNYADNNESDNEKLLFFHILFNKQYGIDIYTNRVMEIYNMDTKEYENVNGELYLNFDELDDDYDYRFEFEDYENKDAINEININVI